MSRLSYKLITLIALSLSLSACPDPAPPKPSSELDMDAPEGGAIQTLDTGMAGEIGGIEAGAEAGAEAGVEAGVEAGETAGAEAGEMAGAEAGEMAGEMTLPPYMGQSCEDASVCGEHESCVYGECRFDLRPTVYRMTTSRVTEPMQAAGLLSAALQSAINNETLNLMFEPGYYNDEGKGFFFIGNGLPEADGYTFRRSFPIQNFTGDWVMSTNAEGESIPMWVLDGQRPFLLAYPTGLITLENGDRFQCISTAPVTVNVSITPVLDETGVNYERLVINVVGYMRRQEIEEIRILLPTGMEVNFADFFETTPLEDLDGDGELMEYPFNLEVEATPIPFLEELARPDQPELRDPNPMVTQPEACD